MMLFSSILVMLAGLAMLLKPDFFWHIEVVCTVKQGEPGKGYLLMMRLLGILCIVMPLITLAKQYL